MTENHTTDKLIPPPGFQFDPDILSDYDDQVRQAILNEAYQAAPAPSFEGVPTLDIIPTFNPTNAPDNEIFARGRQPDLTFLGKGLRSQLRDDKEPIEMWRIVERSKLEDGTGLVSSHILLDNTLGDVEGFKAVKHYATSHDDRMGSPDISTPFVSFSTDPEWLARGAILRSGFGLKGGRDSVVVCVRVEPDRVITSSRNKDEEVLLLGGVSPEEYIAAYSISDFVSQLVPAEELTKVHGNVLDRDKAIGYWALR